MPFFSKKPSSSNSTFTQQQQLPTEFPLQSQQSQPIYPWSAHVPQSRSSLSASSRHSHALSTTATVSGELFLFGGHVNRSNSASNDLYMLSTRDFSITPLKTSGQAPSPRYGHRAAFTSTALLVWGGLTNYSDQRNAVNLFDDDSLYLLNLGTSDILSKPALADDNLFHPVSREWTRVVINGLRPCTRCYHTVTLVGSRLFVFGGRTGRIAGRCFNDIWAFNLNCLTSNPLWESYEPIPGNEKPFSRSGHVSVTTGDRIIIFGGVGVGPQYFNDTWSFDISTRKWTKLQCTGSIPFPRTDHAAVLVDNVMYVFGGHYSDGIRLGNLTALNLSTQRWLAFQDIGSGPCGRSSHAMASDGTRVFLLGGILSADAESNESKLIHVLDTKLITYPDLDPDAVKPSEKATQLVRESIAGSESSTQGQLQQPTLSSSHLNVHPEHGTSLFQKAIPEESDHHSMQFSRERIRSSNDLTSPLPGMNVKPRRVPEDDDDSEGQTEYHGKLVAPGASSEKEVAWWENERIADFEWQLSERNRHIARLTEQLTQNSALLEQAEANAAEAKKRAGLELREMKAKLDELMLSRDEHLGMLEQAQSDLQKATSRAAEDNDRSQCACEQIGEYETKLTEVRAELEEKKSELEAVRLQLTDAKSGWAKSSEKADKLCTQNTAGPVNADEDGVTDRIMERMRAMEAQIASLRWSEKSFEMMECRNEG